MLICVDNSFGLQGCKSYKRVSYRHAVEKTLAANCPPAPLHDIHHKLTFDALSLGIPNQVVPAGGDDMTLN
jgi:hypothetical protein